jgi:predicted outer membrane repeat protein
MHDEHSEPSANDIQHMIYDENSRKLKCSDDWATQAEQVDIDIPQSHQDLKTFQPIHDYLDRSFQVSQYLKYGREIILGQSKNNLQMPATPFTSIIHVNGTLKNALKSVKDQSLQDVLLVLDPREYNEDIELDYDANIRIASKDIRKKMSTIPTIIKGKFTVAGSRLEFFGLTITSAVNIVDSTAYFTNCTISNSGTLNLKDASTLKIDRMIYDKVSDSCPLQLSGSIKAHIKRLYCSGKFIECICVTSGSSEISIESSYVDKYSSLLSIDSSAKLVVKRSVFLGYVYPQNNTHYFPIMKAYANNLDAIFDECVFHILWSISPIFVTSSNGSLTIQNSIFSSSNSTLFRHLYAQGLNTLIVQGNVLLDTPIGHFSRTIAIMGVNIPNVLIKDNQFHKVHGGLYFLRSNNLQIVSNRFADCKMSGYTKEICPSFICAASCDLHIANTSFHRMNLSYSHLLRGPSIIAKHLLVDNITLNSRSLVVANDLTLLNFNATHIKAFTKHTRRGGLIIARELHLKDSVFEKNKMNGTGLIYIEPNSTTSSRIFNTLIAQNNISDALNTNIHVGVHSGLVVQDSECKENKVRATGGCISSSGNLFIINCDFISNNALDGGALYVKSNHTIIRLSRFLNNHAVKSGGAIYIDGKAELNALHFENNKARRGQDVLTTLKDNLELILVEDESIYETQGSDSNVFVKIGGEIDSDFAINHKDLIVMKNRVYGEPGLYSLKDNDANLNITVLPCSTDEELLPIDQTSTLKKCYKKECEHCQGKCIGYQNCECEKGASGEFCQLKDNFNLVAESSSENFSVIKRGWIINQLRNIAIYHRHTIKGEKVIWYLQSDQSDRSIEKELSTLGLKIIHKDPTLVPIIISSVISSFALIIYFERMRSVFKGINKVSYTIFFAGFPLMLYKQTLLLGLSIIIGYFHVCAMHYHINAHNKYSLAKSPTIKWYVIGIVTQWILLKSNEWLSLLSMALGFLLLYGYSDLKTRMNENKILLVLAFVLCALPLGKLLFQQYLPFVVISSQVLSFLGLVFYKVMFLFKDNVMVRMFLPSKSKSAEIEPSLKNSNSTTQTKKSRLGTEDIAKLNLEKYIQDPTLVQHGVFVMKPSNSFDMFAQWTLVGLIICQMKKTLVIVDMSKAKTLKVYKIFNANQISIKSAKDLVIQLKMRDNMYDFQCRNEIMFSMWVDHLQVLLTKESEDLQPKVRVKMEEVKDQKRSDESIDHFMHKEEFRIIKGESFEIDEQLNKEKLETMKNVALIKTGLLKPDVDRSLLQPNSQIITPQSIEITSEEEIEKRIGSKESVEQQVQSGSKLLLDDSLELHVK